MKKTFLISLLAFSICIVSVGCGTTSTENTQSTNQPTTVTQTEDVAEFNEDEYKTLVKEYNDLLYSETVFLSNMAKYEQNYWNNILTIRGSVDFDTLLDATYEWIGNEADVSADSLSTNYESISDMYIDIITVDNATSETEEIEECVKSLYSNYDLLYRMTIGPSGDINTFVSNYNDYITSISSESDILAKLVE